MDIGAEDSAAEDVERVADVAHCVSGEGLQTRLEHGQLVHKVLRTLT